MLKKGIKCKCEDKDQPFYSNEEDDKFEDISMDSDYGYKNLLSQTKAENQKRYCGTYCRNIGPEYQRKIILECLKIEMNNLEEGKVTLTR